jgi:hypothetical protein
MNALAADSGYLDALLRDDAHPVQLSVMPAEGAPSRAFEMERAVLCSILAQKHIPAEVLDIIGVDDFGTPSHRKIYDTSLALHLEGKQVDLLALMAELGDEINQVGGIAYLTEISGLPIFSKNALPAAKVIREESDRRKLSSLVSKAQSWIRDGAPADEIRALIQDSIEGQSIRKNGPPSRADLTITPEELTAARLTPTCIVRNYLYADVGSFCAPGGTGKTTLVLYEAICIALGWSVHGLEVMKSGWTLIITAEDQRERLIARLRAILADMDMTDEQQQTVLKSVLPWDITGEQRRLIEAKDGNIVLTALADDIVRIYKKDPPVLVVFDPLVSFGVSESMINDNEQMIITACRRIVKGLDCCVRVIAHTGKANAREKTLDQYSSRGGSALSDGARMVAVLQTWTPDGKLTPPAGCTPQEGSSITILARPKLSYAPPNLPIIWIRRTGYTFETFTDIQISQEERDEAILDQVERFLASEVQQGRRHNKTSLETAIPNLARNEARKAIAVLIAHGRVVEADLPKEEARTRRKTYLTTLAEFGRIQKSDNFDSAGKNPGNNAAAYRENNGGIIPPPIFPPFSNPAAIGRQDSAALAGLHKEQST